MRIHEFITKLQNLPDNRKKTIIWVIVIVLAIILGVFWLKSAGDRLNKLGQEAENIKLPEIEIPKVESPATNEITK